MKTIFSMDNLFFRTIGKLVDLVWLNILTCVFSLPVITMGPALTAMYSVTLRMARNEEGGITRGFIDAFRSNFKNAIKVWLVTLLILVIYVLDVNLIRQGILAQMGKYGVVVKVAVAVILLFLVMMLNYIFPLLARYDSDVKTTVSNAGKLLVAFFPRSICMPIMYLFPIALMMLSDYWIPMWIFYGLALPAYLCSMMLCRIFDRVDPVYEDEDGSEEV